MQWMVVAFLDVGARMINYRVAIHSHRETLPLLGDETPTAASAGKIGRWTTRWLRLSYASARHYLTMRLRTLARTLLILSSYLLNHLSDRGMSGITLGALGWLQALVREIVRTE